MKKEMKKVPVVRFKGFTSDWEQRKLSELAIFSKGIGYSKSDLRESGTPIILYGRLYTKYETVIKDVDTFVEDKTDSIYSKGGEVIVPASGETAEDISIASVVEKPGILLGSDLNIIHPNKKIDSTFLAISISNGEPHLDMARRAQGKSIVHLHNDDLAQIGLSYPILEEQRKISRCFSQLDHLITLHQRKSDQLKKLKAYFLQNLFPDKGEKVPKIRFKGFTDDWEQRKIGDCFTERKESMPKGELLSVTINESIKRFSELERHDSSNQDKSKYKKVCIGDIAYNSMRMWQGASGFSDYEGIVSPAYTVLKPHDGIDARFVSYLFKTKDLIHVFQINSQGITSDNWNLKFPVLSTINIKIPEKIEEQNKIAEFLAKLDNLITLHQRKLEALQTLKKFLLQNLFV